MAPGPRPPHFIAYNYLSQNKVIKLIGEKTKKGKEKEVRDGMGWDGMGVD